MRLKMALPVVAAATLLAAGAATTSASAAAPTRPSCTTWSDGITAGVSCTGTSRGYYVQATCQNGVTLYGDVHWNGAWSYAYCSSVRSSVKSYASKWL